MRQKLEPSRLTDIAPIFCSNKSLKFVIWVTLKTILVVGSKKDIYYFICDYSSSDKSLRFLNSFLMHNTIRNFCDQGSLERANNLLILKCWFYGTSIRILSLNKQKYCEGFCLFRRKILMLFS